MHQKILNLYHDTVSAIGNPEKVTGAAALLDISSFARVIGRDVGIGIGRHAMTLCQRAIGIEHPELSDDQFKTMLARRLLEFLDSRSGFNAGIAGCRDPAAGGAIKATYLRFHGDGEAVLCYDEEDIGGFGNADAGREALVARVSTMSADQFNACIAALGVYQDGLNQWIVYWDAVDLNSAQDDPMPEAEAYLDFADAEVIEDMRQGMRAAIDAAKSKGDAFDASDSRQDLFTGLLSDWLVSDLIVNHGVSTAMYEDIVRMDEEVYHGRLRWSLITGKGKLLQVAEYVSRRG